MLNALAHGLARAVSLLAEPNEALGRPELVAQAASQSAQLFHRYTKALPSQEDATAAAVAFIRKQHLTERQVDLVASVLCDPLRELSGALPVGDDSFPLLLDTYWQYAESNNLPRLTWYGLLNSYFKFDPSNAQPREYAGWKNLRSFLQKTWPLIDRESGAGVVPDWVTVLRGDPALLSENAAHQYALDYLRGDDEAIKRLSGDLAIPESSWFWHVLVLSAVKRVADWSDEPFKAAIPKLLRLIQSRPVFRDDAIIALLTRYHQCREKPLHQELRDYVVRKDVWRNPKLRAAGLASAWNRVTDEVWRMVLNWVNESNLRDFFGILASRNHAEEGRLAFWSKYLNQISWTRLIFGAETMGLARRNRAIAELIAREDGAYAVLQRARDVDAFVMQIGEHLIVEFSKTPNAAYIYPSSHLKFDRQAGTYLGNTSDLKYGYYGGADARIVHNGPWEHDAASALRQLGIYPDASAQSRGEPAAPFITHPTSTTRSAPEPRPTATPAWEPPPDSSDPTRVSPVSEFLRGTKSERSTLRAHLPQAPQYAPFKMPVLAELVRRFEGAYIDDRRAGGGSGRLWVENPNQHGPLEKMLLNWGFRWAEARQAFYYPERQ